MFHNPDGYTVNDHGIIQNPGKYEAEPIYVPYFASLDWASETLYAGDDTPIDVY